jgi:hypothetical protein
MLEQIEFKRALLLVIVILLSALITLGIVMEDFWMSVFFALLEIYVFYNLILK